jgi:cell division protein ZapA
LGQPIKVIILDQEYLIRSDEDGELVTKIAAYVNEKINEVRAQSDGLSDKKIAILTALNIASEYFQLLDEREKISADIYKRMKKIMVDINDAIDSSPSSGRSSNELEL